MTKSITTKESESMPPLFDELNAIVARGHTLLNDPRWQGGAVRMWFSRADKLLLAIYGPHHELASLWPKSRPELGSEQSRPILVKHLANLERIAESLSASGKTSFSSGNKTIFIGHGGSQIWHQLHTFLTQLGLKCAEFNLKSAAGVTTPNHLDEMLNDAEFAFLIMTAEDKHADGTVHARQNVIHELGLFQGRLGARKAIILREVGCEKFSNADGLTDIPFSHNNLESTKDRIRQVLAREGLL